MWLATLGWTATALFVSSYLFTKTEVLRAIQAGAALLWIVYGIAIHSGPIVVTNVLVAGAAGYTSMRDRKARSAATSEVQES